MKHFTIDELVRSSVATRIGIDNTPTAEVVRALTALVNNVLDPVRETWGKPITVNSGFRCPKLNAAVGGVATSQHVRGEAADISAGSPSLNVKLFEIVGASNIDFDQLIDEKGMTWIHVSYKAAGGNRHQKLRL